MVKKQNQHPTKQAIPLLLPDTLQEQTVNASAYNKWLDFYLFFYCCHWFKI